MCDTTRCIYIITRSPEHHNGIETEDVSVGDVLGVKSYRSACVAFDDMLDTNHKLRDPIFTRGRHNDLDVYYSSQKYFDLR